MDAEELSRKMTEYQAGDAAAFDVLFRELSPRVYGYLVQSTRDRALADDLLQEVFLNVHRARATWRPGSPVLPWLFAIARHAAADRARSSGRRARHEQPHEDVASLPVAAEPDRAADDPRLDELSAALDELPEPQRQVVTMLKVSGMSLKEIAAATGATVGAVKLRAHRGYEALRKRLGAGGEAKKKKGEAA